MTGYQHFDKRSMTKNAFFRPQKRAKNVQIARVKSSLMARVKLILDKRYSDANGTSPVCIRVTHLTKNRYIQTGVRLKLNQWNAKTQTIKGITNSKRTESRLHAMLSMAQNYLDQHPLEIKVMTVDDIKSEILLVVKRTSETKEETVKRIRYGSATDATLQSWGQVLIDRALATNRVGKASWYRDGIHAFIKFNKAQDIPLIDINEQFLEEFKVWAEIEIEGVKHVWKPNTTGVYMRAVRAVINQSIKEKRNFVPADFQPFKTVGIPHETKEVDSISPSDVARLRALKLEEGSELWKARARFPFMFNCQGMNFVDLAKLKVSDRTGQFISYERTKTIRTP